MKKSLIFLGVLVTLAGVVFWLWHSGIISGTIAGLGAMLAGILGGHEVQRKKVQEKAEEVDRIIERMREKDREIERVRRQHDEEVKQVEEDYVNHSVDELIALANERERKRANTSD